jgi:hypothetical protein
MLIAVGFVSLYCNIFQIDPANLSDAGQLRETAKMLVASGWLNVGGAMLALTCLLFFHFKKKRYLLLAVLTILFFAIQFFQYYGLMQKPM